MLPEYVFRGKNGRVEGGCFQACCNSYGMFVSSSKDLGFDEIIVHENESRWTGNRSNVEKITLDTNILVDKMISRTVDDPSPETDDKIMNVVIFPLGDGEDGEDEPKQFLYFFNHQNGYYTFEIEVLDNNKRVLLNTCV